MIIPLDNVDKSLIVDLAIEMERLPRRGDPSRDPHADRWSVRLPTAGPAEVIPPRYVDPHQTPRTHARYLTRDRR